MNASGCVVCQALLYPGPSGTNGGGFLGKDTLKPEAGEQKGDIPRSQARNYIKPKISSVALAIDFSTGEEE